MPNEYVITFINETGSGTEEKNKAVASNQSNDGTTNNKEKRIKQLGGVAMYGYAKRITNKAIGSYINTVSLRTGHEELQQELQLIHNVANRGLSIVESVVMGAKVGGGWGALAGAVIGLGMQGVDIAMRSNEINISRQQENMSLFLNQIRIGSSGGRTGRTE